MKTSMRASVVALAVATTTALAAACAAPDGPEAPGATAGPDVGAVGELTCGGEPVSPGVLESIEDLPTAQELGEETGAALDGTEVPPIDPAAWTIVAESAEHVALLRELDEPTDLGAGDVRTHELLTIDKVDGSRWMLTSATSCALRAGPAGAPDALGQADLALDPDNPLDPAATEIHLLVTERACNSGQDAEGRLVLDGLTESDDAVDLVIGVTPQEGDHTCPSNPPTPFVVELDTPLGDRVVRDAAVVPPRELEVAG